LTITVAGGACLGPHDNNQLPFRVRLWALSATALRCGPDARPAALGGHEISLVIAIGSVLFAQPGKD
jgi:hypothetical protein